MQEQVTATTVPRKTSRESQKASRMDSFLGRNHESGGQEQQNAWVVRTASSTTIASPFISLVFTGGSTPEVYL